MRGKVAAAVAVIETPDGTTLASDIEQMLDEEPDRKWRDRIEAIE